MEKTDSVNTTATSWGLSCGDLAPEDSWEDAPGASPALEAAKLPGGSEIHRVALDFNSD